MTEPALLPAVRAYEEEEPGLHTGGPGLSLASPRPEGTFSAWEVSCKSSDLGPLVTFALGTGPVSFALSAFLNAAPQGLGFLELFCPKMAAG